MSKGVERSIYEDVKAMMNVSSLTYGLTTLNRDRELIEAHKLKDPDFLKNLPKTATEVLGWFKANYDVAKTHFGSEEEANLDLSFLSNIVQNDNRDISSGEARLEVLDDNFAFDDSNSELVYAITTNPDLKRLTIIFRGSITTKDFKQDLKFSGEEIDMSKEVLGKIVPNPCKKFMDDFEEVRIHSGFFEYLFEMKQKTDKKTKFVEILEEVTSRLKKPELEGYHVFVTGHSLGGALALLTAASLAVSDDVKETVKLVTFGMPQVGKSRFAEAFSALEEDGKIRHIRVTNDDDPVPQPFAYFGYKHTGVHLNLSRPGWITSHTYSIKKSERGWLFPIKSNGMSIFSLSWIYDFGNSHSMAEYSARMELGKEDLNNLTIDGVYNDVLGIPKKN